jgi:hypothetical protein
VRLVRLCRSQWLPHGALRACPDAYARKGHVDRVDHHYPYTTALGHRHALPMVTRQRGHAAQPTGAATAVVEEPEQLYVFAARVEAKRAYPDGCL